MLDLLLLSMTTIHNLSVSQVYDKIASDFNITRVRIWGSVKTFIDSIPADSKVLELGCGNGKNMLYRNDLDIIGIDISAEQVAICKKKNLRVSQGSIVSLDFDTSQFDYMLCIATYHHLDNDDDRKNSLKEMFRCLNVGGKLLITVWAMEQPDDGNFRFTKSDELVPWLSRVDGNTYLRYYHIYRTGELQEEINRLCPELTITSVGWELGNWWCIAMK